MHKVTRAEAVRGYFAAYRAGDRNHLERALTEDFTFTSPYDDRIDKATYFERCWPNRNLIREHAIERIFEQGDEAFALYRCIAEDGNEFRNTEFFVFQGGRLKEVQVYFGAGYRNGQFLKQSS